MDDRPKSEKLPLKRGKRRLFFWLNAFGKWGTLLQFAIILTHCLVLWCYSDVTWWGTLVAFAPRWPAGIPLGLVLPVALALRRWKLVLINVIGAAILLFPVMGLEISGLGQSCPSDNGMNLRVLTCNVHGNAFRAMELNRVIAETAADVVALQECPPSIIEDCFNDEDWFIKVFGEFCVASRFPIQSSVGLDRAEANGWGSFALLCRIEGPDGDFEFVSVHLLSPRQGLESLRAERQKAAAQAQEVFRVRHEESKQIYRELRNISGPIDSRGRFQYDTRKSASSGTTCCSMWTPFQ